MYTNNCISSTKHTQILGCYSKQTITCLVRADTWTLKLLDTTTRQRYLFQMIFEQWTLWFGQWRKLIPFSRGCHLETYMYSRWLTRRKRRLKWHRHAMLPMQDSSCCWHNQHSLPQRSFNVGTIQQGNTNISKGQSIAVRSKAAKLTLIVQCNWQRNTARLQVNEIKRGIKFKLVTNQSQPWVNIKNQ